MSFLDEVAEDMHLSDPIVSVAQYLENLKNSIIWEYEWGIIAANGQNMHIHILSNYRKKVFLRKPLREVAFFMFSQYPVIYTQILKKPEVLEFDLRIGWKFKKEDNLLYHLEMKKEDFIYA